MGNREYTRNMLQNMIRPFALGLLLTFVIFSCKSQIIYVAPAGLDGKGATTSDPASLSYAVNEAPITATLVIRAAIGSYNASQLVFRSNTVLEGGYDPNESWRKRSDVLTVVQLSPPVESYAMNDSIIANSSTHHIGAKATEVENVSIKDVEFRVLEAGAVGTDTTQRGISVYGIYVANSTKVTVSRTKVSTGPASAGAIGQTGLQGENGRGGGPGGQGSIDGSSCGAGGFGGRGGGAFDNGGVASSSCGSSGGNGGPFSARTGAGGGAGGRGGAEGTNTGGVGGDGGATNANINTNRYTNTHRHTK